MEVVELPEVCRGVAEQLVNRVKKDMQSHLRNLMREAYVKGARKHSVLQLSDDVLREEAKQAFPDS